MFIFAAEEGGGGLEFPPIENLIEWPAYLFQDTFAEFNKISLMSLLAMIIPAVLFLAYRGNKIHGAIGNIVEGIVEFIDSQVILPAIGPEGLKYRAFLISIFLFVFVGNLFEVIPTFHMPVNARMAAPLVLAITSWVMFIAIGVKTNGGWTYFKANCGPPGLPKALYILVTPIELFSNFLVRPFSLAVRLFANMLAGHILLVTFGVLCITLFTASPLIAVLPFSFAMLTALTGFEMMVAFLQGFVFALLTAVYIGSSLHVHH